MSFRKNENLVDQFVYQALKIWETRKKLLYQPDLEESRIASFFEGVSRLNFEFMNLAERRMAVGKLRAKNEGGVDSVSLKYKFLDALIAMDVAREKASLAAKENFISACGVQPFYSWEEADMRALEYDAFIIACTMSRECANAAYTAYEVRRIEAEIAQQGNFFAEGKI